MSGCVAIGTVKLVAMAADVPARIERAEVAQIVEPAAADEGDAKVTAARQSGESLEGARQGVGQLGLRSDGREGAVKIAGQQNAMGGAQTRNPCRRLGERLG